MTVKVEVTGGHKIKLTDEKQRHPFHVKQEDLPNLIVDLTNLLERFRIQTRK